MANYHGVHVDDEYFTPYEAWYNIRNYIPEGKIVWEPFCGDGTSATHLQLLGFQVICKPEDNFFENNKGEIVVTNPPFSCKKQVMRRLKEIDKPFIIICPSAMLCTKYFKKLFPDIQIIVPKTRINFAKNTLEKSRCNFDCYYYCYKIDMQTSITFL